MAQTFSFDVTTGVDLQEVDNAVNQAQKELAQRYDFKGSHASLEFKRAEAMLVLVADSEFQMKSLFDIVQTRLIKRHVSIKNLDIGELKPAGNDTVRLFTSSKKWMGERRNGWFLLAAGWTSCVLITALDLYGLPDALRKAWAVVVGH